MSSSTSTPTAAPPAAVTIRTYGAPSSTPSVITRYKNIYIDATKFQLVSVAAATLLVSAAGVYLLDRFLPSYSPLRCLRNHFSSARLDFKENQLLRHVYARAAQDNPESVLAVIDSFAREQSWLMNIGEKKGQVLVQEIKKKQPKIVVEVGTYMGYSAILIASNLPLDSHLYCIEIDPLNAAIATKIIEFAGLSNRITVIVGTISSKLALLQSRYRIKTIDLLFLDHCKTAYLSDFKLIERGGLIKTSSVIVADNILYPGVPDYVEYIRNNKQYDSTFYKGYLEYSDTIKDGVEVSVRL